MELRRRQRRKQALKILRAEYEKASSAGDKKAILAKVAKISPTLNLKLFSPADK